MTNPKKTRRKSTSCIWSCENYVFIWGISQSPGDQFAERMLFLMVVTLVWIQLQLHLGLEIKNYWLYTLPKKKLSLRKKNIQKIVDFNFRLPFNPETVIHMQLQKGNHWWLLQICPRQCPTAGHCPPWRLGCFPRKNGWVNQWMKFGDAKRVFMGI